jgi:hypothetical protein
MLSSEHVEAKWAPFEQLLDLDCSDWMRRAFAALLARQSGSETLSLMSSREADRRAPPWN